MIDYPCYQEKSGFRRRLAIGYVKPTKTDARKATVAMSLEIALHCARNPCRRI
jgi:hypothetical protein